MAKYDSIIRWTSKDSNKLTKAINKFNREISSAIKTEYLPKKAKYGDIREHITSRREFNRVIASLNRASTDNLTNTTELASGEKVTQWEYNELMQKRIQAGENLLNELEDINKNRVKSGNLYMGQERISEIQDTLEFLDKTTENLENFKKARKRLVNISRTDYQLAKDKLFMENFYTALEGAKNFEHYPELRAKLKSIRNPSKFYEFVRESNILMDIFLWYKGDITYGSFDNNESAFNNALVNELGIQVELD